jgi:hypothetical protein
MLIISIFRFFRLTVVEKSVNYRRGLAVVWFDFRRMINSGECALAMPALCRLSDPGSSL